MELMTLVVLVEWNRDYYIITYIILNLVMVPPILKLSSMILL